ncbi:MAG: NAD(P)H-hydrate dehydratase [Pseudomonadota bacterium]
MHELLTTHQMATADQLAVEMGVPSLTLMENAGLAVADEAEKMAEPNARIVVLCGPGNNGGDGFVAARHLQSRGCGVSVYLYGERGKLKGDAAENATRWLAKGTIEYTLVNAGPEQIASIREDLGKADLIIDALFGAGLTRALPDTLMELFSRQVWSDSCPPILAVDVPSGLDGTTGAVVGDHVIRASRTVTFFRRKPAHVLYPGRDLCGEVILADIGIPDGVFDQESGTPVKTEASVNTLVCMPILNRLKAIQSHKYDFGHAVVFSGPLHQTGAARLSAGAALRVGAGLVTVACPPDAVHTNAAHLTAVMLVPAEGAEGAGEVLSDRRKNAVLIGPGFGVGAETKAIVAAILGHDCAVVLDADALTSFEANPPELLELISRRRLKVGSNPRVVLTPHEGEFKRLFPDITGSKLERARAAADRSGAVIILKGPDTVIGVSTGAAFVNVNAPPWLATAGSGDVLAGFVLGLLAQGQSAVIAARNAVWLHGECANAFGPGLISEDLPGMIPTVYADLLK